MSVSGLKNINMLSKEQYNGITSPSANELYAISGSGFGFPSNRYEDLTLGASGTLYTAPANGWAFISVNISAADGYVQLYRAAYSSLSRVTKADTTAITMLPVMKGESYNVYYTTLSRTNYFRFIYAEGE